MTQSPQNPTPSGDGIKRGSGRAEVLPFLGFLGLIYIALTMGTPDRMLWESPANAVDREPIPPMCIHKGEWSPCKK